MILYKYLINSNLVKQYPYLDIPETIGSDVSHLHVVGWLFYSLLLGSSDIIAAHTKKVIGKNFLLMNQISKRNINSNIQFYLGVTQPAFTCSKLTIETLEQGVKYVQS